MAQPVDLRERLKMRFATVDYCEKQETYGKRCAPAGTIATDVLNIPDLVLEELQELTMPMLELVDYLNHNKNPNRQTLAWMLTASKNVFAVVELLRNVPPFSSQDFTWLDGKLKKVFSSEAVIKAYHQRKKETGEIFIPAMCLVAQLGFGIRDFRRVLIPLVESLNDEDISRSAIGFAQKFDSFFKADENRPKEWMSFSNVSVEYLAGERGLVRRMHYASFPSMFRSNLYEALAVGNAPKRCPICNRFFLTTNARRQIYCDGYAPEEYGDISCRQVGNQMGRRARELAENNPILIRYHQAVNTIEKRVERRTLDKETAAMAKDYARDLKSMAIANPEYANGDYITDMPPDALIAAVTRK